MLKHFHKALVAIAIGATALVAACNQQADEKSDQTAAASEQPARPPQRAAEQPRPAATTSAPTPMRVMSCVTAGLTADNRTQAQARRLPVGAEVTINGAKQRLAAGQSYWSLCSGPSIHERLAASQRQLAEANEALRTLQEQLEAITAERDTLVPLAYIDPAADRNQDNTWKQAAQGGGFGWLSWLVTVLMVAFLVATVLLVRANRRLSSEYNDYRFKHPRTRSEEPEGDGVVTRN